MMKNGFTLIELSIVLVIIGLLVGGVLVGRDLIEMAGARSQLGQVERIQLAVTTFKLKYNCMPGDCKNANALGLGRNGDGDKILGSRTNTDYCFYTNGSNLCITDKGPVSGASFATRPQRGFHEGQRFFSHLSAAGLLENGVSEMPTTGPFNVSDFDKYFPKDALGKAYLEAFMWNHKILIHSGKSVTNTTYGTTQFDKAPFSAAQTEYMTTKAGSAQIYVNKTDHYPEALEKNQKLFSVGVNNNTSLAYYSYWPPTTGLFATDFTPCAISDGAGGYKHNIANDGDCNIMWQVDY